MTDDDRQLAEDFMARAQRELAAARHELTGGFIEKTVGSSYYAALYATKALLATRGLETNRHSAALRLLSREFVATGLMHKTHSKVLGILLERRISAAYDARPTFTGRKQRGT